MDYYLLSPIDDTSLTIKVPVTATCIRDILTAQEAEAIIKEIPNVPCIDSDDKSLENIYKELLSTDDPLDLVKIIKTTYLRNKKRVDNGKKISDKDNNYFQVAEKSLYNLLGISLNMSYEECKKYVIENLSTKKEAPKC